MGAGSDWLGDFLANSQFSIVYVGIIGSDNGARFYWDELTGTSFSAYSPPVTDADDNLDFTYCPYGLYTSGYVSYMSYESTTGNLVVWRMSFLGTWDQVFSAAITGSNGYTSISAFKETVMAAVEYDYPEGNGIRYYVSYNHGDSWAYGNLYEPGISDPDAHGADVSLHSGAGSMITYHREEGAFDYVYHVARRGYQSVPWGDPFAFNNYDSMSATQTKIEWLGVGCVSSYGMMYRASDAIPYYDLVTPRGFFCDGFETGNASAWD